MKHILAARPVLTRVLLNQIDGYLTDPARRQKTARISNMFPNQEGLQGGSDGYLSLIDCATACLAGTEVCLQRHRSGMEWLSVWEKCKLQLHICATTIPKVTLDASDRAELVLAGKELIDLKNQCWDLFVVWVTERLADIPNGLRDVSLIYPNIVERLINWDTTLQHLKADQYDRIFVYHSPDSISPTMFRGLKSVFDDCDRVLAGISNARESKSNVCNARATVIKDDVEVLLCEISSKRRQPGVGSPQRLCWLDEIKSLQKRIDLAREFGCTLDVSLKSRLNQEKSLLLEDENVAKLELKNHELVNKARIHEASQSVPKRAVQGLTGYDNWLSWSHEVRERLVSVMTESAKASILYESLKVVEDKEFLKGSNSSIEMLNYLSGKYNRPAEVCEALLSQVKKLPPAKTDRDMVRNIMKFQTVHRDLSRYAAASKVDSYFINSIRHVLLTDVELKRYLREHEAYLVRHLRKSKSAKRSSTLGVGLDVLGASGDDDSDVDSDDSLDSKFSFADPGAFVGDKASNRDRKFFLKFCKNLLTTLRHLESAQHHTGGGKGSCKSSSFKTDGVETGDRTCIIKGCKIRHVNKHGKPVNTLSLCNLFKNLTLKERCDYVNKGKACRTCTTPGHQSKSCKSTNTCQAKLPDGSICNKKEHHTLLHPDGTTGGGNPKKAGKSTDAYQTDSATSKPAVEAPPLSPASSCHKTSSDTAGASVASVPPPMSSQLESTECNSIRSFAATLSECYLADQMESRDQHKLTNCGSVTVKGTPQQDVLCLFDLCSTDNWATASLLKKVTHQYLQPFDGIVRTMNANKRMQLPRVLIRVKLDEGWIRLVCLIVPEIGYKARVETPRFERLVKSFNLLPEQFDQNSGPIELLLGLSEQHYGTNRIGSFFSPDYPKVGIYTSPLLSRGAYIFVGVIQDCTTSFSTQTFSSECFRVSTFNVERSLHQFLEAEKTVPLIEVKCNNCLLKENCQRCRHTNSPRSIQDLEETRMIEESISCVPVAGKTNVWKFELDYPELPDVNLSEKYKCGANSNKNIAIKSTTNLRNKLDKEGFLDEFHTQITTAIEKGEFVIVTPEVAKAHDGLAMSYQLINFVHKTSSTSTKLRVISNSSISRHGGSLNDNLAVGVNSMNATLDVLAGWCAYGYAMLTDLSSAYRSVRTKAKTNSLRRFYWYSN